MNPPSIAVIIPCYNAANTLTQAINSALQQVSVNSIWIVDDGSTDHSFAIAEQFATQYPNKIKCLRMPTNGGAALARNWAALHVSEQIIAFLDADDLYERYALDPAAFAFRTMPELAVIRLALHPFGWPDKYTKHAGFARAWRGVEMTGAGNIVIKRSLFLAAGGFPTMELFKRHGGEDAALGLALHASVMVATLFDQPGVHYRHKTNSHGERLLDGILFGHVPEDIKIKDIQQANTVTEHIKTSLSSLQLVLSHSEGKIVPLLVQDA